MRKLWIFGRHGSSARAGNNPWARIQSSGCYAVFRFSSAKQKFQQTNTWFLSILAVFSDLPFTHSSRSLSRGGFIYRLFTLHFLLTGTCLISCLGATSVLNEFFKVMPKVRWPQASLQGLLASRPRQALQDLVQEQGCFARCEHILEQG